MLRTLLLGAFALFILSGCANIRRIEVPESQGQWTSETDASTTGRQPGRMYTRHKEGKYVIKPEPYSIASKKKDPELLGPQRTLPATPAPESTPAKTVAKKSAPGMSREACISLIGQEKFNTYVQKYGGEKGALRRCLILKRIRG